MAFDHGSSQTRYAVCISDYVSMKSSCCPLAESKARIVRGVRGVGLGVLRDKVDSARAFPHAKALSLNAGVVS